MKLWEKGGHTDPLIHAFTVGRDPAFDLRLAEYDVLGSLAHARMLAENGLMDADALVAVEWGLRDIHTDIIAGRFVIEDGVEDVHSQVELQLTRAVGEAGKRIHTARSRNDQVLVDVKMFLRDRIRDVVEQSVALAEELLDRADASARLGLPGYTHGQAAMPSSFGQWLAAHAESLEEDQILLYAAYRLADRNPLGSAAGYGSSFPIDRMRTTELLGFETMHVNAIDAQLSRGKTERIAAQAFASVAATLARFAADVCLFASGNYGFIQLREEITTGSSIMPHKRNPDVFELVRARCNRIQAVPGDIAMCMANLPSGYHRDLQIIKETLFPAIDDLLDCIRVLRHSLAFIDFRDDILADGRYAEIFSVDAIRQLMEGGLPFRDAYREVAGQLRTGTLAAPPVTASTHEGSPGNLANHRIRQALAREAARFPFARRDEAFAALLRTHATD